MTNTPIATKVFSLFAEQDSELCVKQGRVWATVGTGGDDVDDNYGDHFLVAGQKLSVSKGQNLVFESMNAEIPVFDFMGI
jgi:surfactin synthase thioesterase subunit